jgi:predicted dehydrogenase
MGAFSSNGVRRTPQRKLSFGIAGLGYWGPNLLRVLAEMADIEVKWICDRDPARLDRYKSRYPGALATTRIDDILEDPVVDAVVIATPVFTHFYLASRALSTGKHTFVEKPLAPSAGEAAQLVMLAENNDLVLMCGHTFVHSPPVRAVKTLLEKDELGDIYFVSSSRVNLGLHQRDVSVIWDLAPHDFSILLYWFEEMPETIRAVGRDSIVKGVPDVAFITMELPSGVLANMELSWLAPSKLRRTAVVGSKKMVVYDDTSPEPIRIFDHGVVYEDPETFGQYHLSYRTGDIVSPKLDTAEPIAIEMDDFAAAIRAGGHQNGHLDLALNVVRLVEAAEASMRDGGSEILPTEMAASENAQMELAEHWH